jgi:hypothetical protein
MIYLIKVFFRDKIVLVSLFVSLLFQILAWWYIFFYINLGEVSYFLHYNIIFGVDLVGLWWKILILPISGVVVLFLNFSGSFYFYNIDKVLSRLLAIFTPIFQLFLFIAVYLIVDMNI